MVMAKKLLLVLVLLITIESFLSAQFTTSRELQDISHKIQQLFPYLKARTVLIKIRVGRRYGYGSGAIISADGLILTCAHVAEISDDLLVVTADGKEHSALKLGMNPVNDYALLRIPGTHPYFQLADSQQIKTLDWVAALGHPGGPYPDYQPALSVGRVRGLHKRLPIEFGAKFYDDAIQTDVPIFSGNSGGPLVDLQGRLVGINGAIMLVNDLAFAVPINEIKEDLAKLKKGINVSGRPVGGFFEMMRVMRELQEDLPPQDMYRIFKDTPLGKIIRVLFGSEIPTLEIPRPKLGVTFRHNAAGIVATAVTEGSVGQMAGFEPNDHLVAVNDDKTVSLAKIKEMIAATAVGKKIRFTIERNNQQRQLVVIFDKRAYSRQRCLERALVYQGLHLMAATVRIKSGEQTLGYGVVLSSDGWVLTNYQMLAGHSQVVVQLQSGGQKAYLGRVSGYHAILDIALVKIEPKTELRPVAIGDDRKLKIGEWVISGGTPEGILHAGMVSARERQVPPHRKVPTMGLFGLLGSPNKSELRAYPNVIQHDSDIEKGQFGTPLVNQRGELVGINVGHFFRGTTFATPISRILPVLPALKQGQSTPAPPEFQPYQPAPDPLAQMFKYLHPENLGEMFRDLLQDKQSQKPRGFLGVRIAQGWQGVEIIEVIKGYSADRAGLSAGDIIIKIGKQKITSVVILLESIGKLPPGSIISLTVIRKNKNGSVKKIFRVQLDKRP